MSIVRGDGGPRRVQFGCVPTDGSQKKLPMTPPELAKKWKPGLPGAASLQGSSLEELMHAVRPLWRQLSRH
jgi:hypothetical protein